MRHERSDGTEHSKNAAAIIRGCIDFVMSYSSMLLRALQPVDLTVASLEETTQVVALLRALSRHRQTWTFAMPAQRQTELLESARLLLRDLSIVIDPRSTDSTLQFRAVSPDERWKEENQRSKKRFKRAFKKIKGLSLMKRLKSKLSSKKKSGGGMLLRLAAAAKKSSDKEKKEDELTVTVASTVIILDIVNILSSSRRGRGLDGGDNDVSKEYEVTSFACDSTAHIFDERSHTRGVRCTSDFVISQSKRLHTSTVSWTCRVLHSVLYDSQRDHEICGT